MLSEIFVFFVYFVAIHTASLKKLCPHLQSDCPNGNVHFNRITDPPPEQTATSKRTRTHTESATSSDKHCSFVLSSVMYGHHTDAPHTRTCTATASQLLRILVSKLVARHGPCLPCCACIRSALYGELRSCLCAELRRACVRRTSDTSSQRETRQRGVYGNKTVHNDAICLPVFNFKINTRTAFCVAHMLGACAYTLRPIACYSAKQSI